jgi:Ca2+-binding RTX toxin-like protein
VTTGQGDDRVSFGQGTNGTIDTGIDDDVVTIGGNATSAISATTGLVTDSGINLDTGSDSLTIVGTLGTKVTAGSADETGNANGKDSVSVGGDMLGTASITTMAGDDTVSIGGNLRTAYEDDASIAGRTTEANPGQNNPGKGAVKTGAAADIDKTVAADIDTGEGNDSVEAGTLESAVQWNDNIIPNNINADDTIHVVGATIALGNGDDHLQLGLRLAAPVQTHNSPILQEQTLVDAGGGHDHVRVNFNGSVVMAADNSSFLDDYIDHEQTLGAINRNGTQDTLGAKIALGSGDDHLLFTDVGFDDAVGANYDAGMPGAPTALSDDVFDGVALIVDSGAVVDGGADDDILEVRTVDRVDVVKSEEYWYDSVSGAVVQGDADSLGNTDLRKDEANGQGGHILGVEQIDLVIANQVTSATDTNGRITDSTGDQSPYPDRPVGLLDQTVTDNEESSWVSGGDSPMIRLDVHQVDDDLEVVNLQSFEARQELEDTDEYTVDSNADNELDTVYREIDNGFMAGQTTMFEVDNLRSDVELNLQAYEVNALDETQRTDFRGNKLDGVDDGEGFNLTDNCEIDVTVAVNMDARPGPHDSNRSFTLNMLAHESLATGDLTDNNYDLRLISQDEFTNAATTPRPGLQHQLGHYARDVELNVETGGSHHINFSNAFGTVTDSVYDVRNQNGVSQGTIEANDTTATVVGSATQDALDSVGAEVEREFGTTFWQTGGVGAPTDYGWTAVRTGDVRTSLTVNGGDAGETLLISGIHADNITVTGDDNTFVVVDQQNQYRISTGNGDDLIDLRADTFVNDSIEGGADHDTLVINAGDGITGSEFNAVNGIEDLVVVALEGEDSTTALDVDPSDLERIVLVTTNRDGSMPGFDDSDDLDMESGEVGHQVVNVSANLGAGKLVVDADTEFLDFRPDFCPAYNTTNRHSDRLTLTIDTAGVTNTDIDVYVNVAEGTKLAVNNNVNEQYNVFVTISSLANTHINDNEIDQPWMYEYNAGGDEEGELQLTTIDNPLPAIPGPGASAGSSIDQLWLLDSSRDVSGTDLTTGSAGHNVFVKVEDSWANASANTGLFGADLIIHAADINDTDESVFNVRNEIDGSAETSASLLIIGTQDNDDINGGDANDTLVGESGNDLLYGGKGADWLEGGVGSDQLAGDYDGSAFEIFPIGGRDTLVGGAGADLIYGGVGADSLVGGADGDVFVYTRRADSAGVLSNTDTLADFDPTVDRIDVRYLAFDPALQNVVGGYFDGDQNKYIGGGSLFGREMVFGRIVPTDTQLGGNTVNYADATAAAHQGNGIIEVIYQRDEGVLWFDLNDDGSLDNNDLRIRLPYGTKVDGLYSELPVDSGSPTWLLGVNDASFFDYIRTSEFGTAGLPQFGGTVVNDHIIVDTVSTLPEIDNDTGLDEPRGLATYGGHDEILVRTNSDFWIDAGDGNDVVDGSDGNETIIGGDGDDSVLAGEGDDSVLGGNGDDTVDGEAGDDYVLATPGDDSILGGEGDDTLYGGIEDDTIRGEQGEDLIISGNETPYVLDGNALTDDDLVEGGSGNDTISTGQGEDWVDGGTEDDRISTGSGDDTAYGDSGADVIEASDGNDDVYGGAGNDSVDAGAGADWVEGNGDDDILIGREGNDTVTGGDGEDYVNGGDDADQLFGNLDEDTMIGGDGADWMDGGSDSDLMMGNAGDDSMYGADGEDWVEGNEGSDLIEGGEGNDILSGGNLLEIFGPLMAESPLAPVILFPQIDFDGLLGDLDGKDTIHGQGGEDIAFGGGNDDIVTGGEGEDALYGDAPGLLEFINLMQNGSGDPDTLEALVSGDDSIEGNEGEDYIEGGFGHDTILGGTENDELFGDWGLSLNLGVGPSVIIPISDADTVFDALGHADSMLGGTGSDRMYGQGGDDTMFGGDNDEDVIDGSDIMYGGAGNDRMNGELGDDYMDGGDGNDTMLGSAPTNSISDADIMLGEDGQDLMYGYDGSDGMSGGNGDDTMYGGDENDYMEGGSDSDVMHGEEGNDSMAGGNAAALWTPLTAFAIDPDGYSDAPTSDDYVIADLGDDSDDDTMTGGEGNDTVVGMADDDSLSGGNGDDLLFGDYIGEDVLNYFRGGLVSDDTVWTLWDGQDVISGGNGNDDIWGGFGNDTIDGDAGADWIQGDYGDETRKFVYIGDSNPPAPSSDDLLDFGAEGNDDLIYGGTGNDTIDGNQGDDWIDGEQDDDSLFGSDGDDTLIGGTGRDFIDGGSDDDSILGGDGNDTVYGDDGADFVDGGSDDDSINGGDGDDTLLGGADDGFDDIFGSDGSDSIVGGGGNDDLAGGEGNDTIYGDAGDDAINGGSDDDALFGGAGNDDMVGSDGDDWLDGGSGDDDMEGSDGDDTMFGADGNDDMYGGSDDDWLFGDETFSGQAPSPEAPLPAGPWTNTDDHIHGDEGADSIFGGVGDDSIDLSDDGFSSDDEEQTDWLHLSVDTTTETQDPTDSLFGALGNDTIDNFDTTDVDGNDGNNDGDWLVLLKGDVSNGSEPTQSVVMVTDWSNDVVFLHSDETGLGETMITFDPDEDPGFDTVGQSGVSIADASLVIVKTAFETDDSEFADDWSFEATFDSSDANEMSDGNNDFEFRYDTAEGVDEFLEAQNGTFNGSVFVITDDANNSGNVYLWWDADAADENDGNGEIDTVLVGTFTSQQNAEDFFDNIKWVDSFGFTA